MATETIDTLVIGGVSTEPGGILLDFPGYLVAARRLSGVSGMMQVILRHNVPTALTKEK